MYIIVITNFLKKQKMKGYEFVILFSECRLWLTYVYSPVAFYELYSKPITLQYNYNKNKIKTKNCT